MEIIKIYQHKNLQLTKKEFYEKLSNFVEDNKESLVDKMSSYTYNNGREEVVKQGHTKDSHISQSPRTMLLRNLSQNIPCSTFDTEELANQYIYNALKSEKVRTKITNWFFNTDLSKKDIHDVNYLELTIGYHKHVGKGIDLGFEELKSREMKVIIRRANGENELGFYIDTAYPNLNQKRQERIEKTGREFTVKAIEYNQELYNRNFTRYSLINRMLHLENMISIDRGKTSNEVIVSAKIIGDPNILILKIGNEISYFLYNEKTHKTTKTTYKEIKDNHIDLSRKMQLIISAIKRADLIMEKQRELELDS